MNYLAHATRVDIAFATNQLSRACQKPRERRLTAAKQVLSYLAGTADWGLHFSKQGGTYLECYADASYNPDASLKSMVGVLCTFAGGPVYWTSRKQDRITMCTCDSESLSMQTAMQYVENLLDLLEDFDSMQKWPTPVFSDNSATVALSVDPHAHKKSVQLTRAMAYVR